MEQRGILTFGRAFITFYITTALLISNAITYYIDSSHNNTILNNFGFGSCFGGYLMAEGNDEIFHQVIKRHPQVWLWLGDVAYIEEHISFKAFAGMSDLNMTHAKNEYDFTKKNIPF